MHEIVTLQFGKQANYLATHFWNAQESYFTYSAQDESPVNHDIHFRPGISPDGSDTFTPRAVIYDLKNEFGALRRINALYEDFGDQAAQEGSWSGNTVTHQQPPVHQIEYQQHLNDGVDPPALTKEKVRYWSDFSRVFYHPRSVVQIYESELDPERKAFDDWSSGEELFASMDAEHDLLDRDLRPFVEECDQLQGLSMLTSVENSWSGFSARYIDRLRDEFGKLPIWVWTTEQRSKAAQARLPHSLVNEACALREISPQATMYMPISAAPPRLPHFVKVDEDSAWMTSALQAAAYETITMPTRLHRSSHQTPALMDELSIFLNLEGNKNIAQSHLALAEDPDMPQTGSAEINLFPDDEQSRQTFAELEVFRGTQVHDYLQKNSNGSSFPDTDLLRRSHSTLPFPILDSFPAIFQFGGPALRSASVRARLSVSSSASKWIRQLDAASRHRISLEERESFTSDLQDIREHYEVEGASSDEWDD